MDQTIRPKRYPANDAAEADTITVLRGLVDPKIVKLHIEERDKVPNTDGWIEIVDEEGNFPLGKVEVQLKKLPDGERNFSCELAYVAYAMTTTNPMLLLCVDTDAKVAYWKHLTDSLLTGKESQKTVTINFTDDDLIDSGNIYLNKWLTIITDYQKRISNYLDLEGELTRVKQKGKPLDSMKQEDILAVQAFIDEINRLMDYRFQVIKKLLFPWLWKFKIVIEEYSENLFVYDLHGIPNGRVGSQIEYLREPLSDLKKSDDESVALLTQGWSIENLSVNPIQKAKALIGRFAKDIFEKDMFIFNSPYLASEYIFAFVDHMNFCLGIVPRETLNLNDLKYALERYLPTWCLVAAEERGLSSKINSFDPLFEYCFIPLKMREKILEKVQSRLESGTPLKPVIIESSKYSLPLLLHSIEILKGSDYLIITRPHNSPNYDLVDGEKGFTNLELFRSKDRKDRIEDIFMKFPIEYNMFVDANQLVNLPNIFKEYNKIIVAYSEEDIRNLKMMKIAYYYLETDRRNGEQIIISEQKMVEKERGEGCYLVSCNEKTYKCHKYSLNFAHDIFGKTPMLDLIYEFLADAFSREFPSSIFSSSKRLGRTNNSAIVYEP